MKDKELLDYLNSKPIDFDILIELVDITNGNRESLEIETIYNDFTIQKKPNSIGYYIQDINKHKQLVTWNDLNAFCQKEIGFNKRNRFHERNKKTLEQKIMSILTAEFDEEFFNIYRGMSY